MLKTRNTKDQRRFVSEMLRKVKRAVRGAVVGAALAVGCASPLHELREPARQASNFHDSYATLRGFVHSGS